MAEPNLTHLGAAAGGSIVGLKFFPGSSWSERFFNLVCSFLCAIFFGPALSHWYGSTSDTISAAIVFTCGSVGMVVAGSLIEGFKTVAWAEVIRGWIPKRPGGE